MRIPVLTLLVLPLMACATTPPEPAGSGAPGACNASAARSYVGQTATASAGAQILRVSGAASLRWGPPDSAWTMDYRPDRVNVRYDRSMMITDVTCG